MARTRRRSRRGQSLVEFALFLSVILLLLGGLVDLGTLLDDHLSVVTASRHAALAAATAGTNAKADCVALATVALATRDLRGVSVTRIVIYQSGSDGLPSASYEDVYLGNPGCTNSASPPVAAPANWLPATRINAYGSANSLGVEIDYTYDWQMLLIAIGSLNVVDHAVMPITPST